MHLKDKSPVGRLHPKGKGLSVFADALVILTVLASLGKHPQAQESGPDQEGSPSSFPVTTEAAVRAPQEGETLRFAEREIYLSATLHVPESHASIHGRPEGTKVHCPENGGAFVIKGRNITLMRLDFVGCVNGSAIAISDDDALSLCSDDEQPGCAARRRREGWERAVRVVSCSFSNNTYSRGAAIFASNGHLLVEQSAFEENQSRHGGAIYAISSLVAVRDSYFDSNSAENSTSSVGGAIACFLSVVTVENSVFLRNEAVMGGALWTKQATVAVDSSRFSENAAQIVGGGCALLLSDLSLQNTTFEKCNATMGAGLWMKNSTGTALDTSVSENFADNLGGGFQLWQASLTIKSLRFDSNSAVKGGALYSANSTAAVQNVRVVRNNATIVGGGFAIYFTNTTVTDAKFVENGAVYGGATTIRQSNASMHNIEVLRNRAQNLGGAFTLWRSNVEVKEIQFFGNSAAVGGAFWARNSTTTLQSIDCIRNSAAAMGGAFELFRSQAVANDSNFQDNEAPKGGAVRLGESSARVTNGVFTRNFASFDGGAIELSSSNATLVRGKLVRNQARRGGAVSAGKSSVEIVKVTLSRNRALFGGAVDLRDNSTLNARRTPFRKNSGNHGGAIHSQGKGSSVVIAGVTFKDNTGEKGGALCLKKRTELSLRPLRKVLNAFRSNSADEGGALFCDNCELDFQAHVEFTRNRGLRLGGGIHVENAKSITLPCLHCDQNVAPLGGALSIASSRVIRIEGSSTCVSSFTDNTAVSGGALYVDHRTSRNGTYNVINSTFARNHALDSKEFSNADEVSLKRIDRPVGDSRSPHWIMPDCTTRSCGNGGAVFVSIGRVQQQRVKLLLSDLVFSSNKASIGGAVYLEMLESTNRRTTKHWCLPHESINQTCGSVEYDLIELKDNHASFAGGGIFMSGAQDPYSFCKSDKSQTAGKVGDRNVGCFKLSNNTIKEGGYGRDFATEAAFLRGVKLERRLANIPSGELLGTIIGRVLDNTASPSFKNLTINVTDALDQTITTGPDSNLLLELLSDWTVGGTRYKANRGTVDIGSTIILGVAVSDTIVLQTDDERRLSYSLNFTTSTCKDGEITDGSELRCRSCSKNLYTFDRQLNCRPCEAHAICNRTTALVPETGYWHSTPFSPLMRRCPVETSCSSENRIEKLSAYYKDFDLLLEKMQTIMEMIESRKDFEVSQAEYPQCAEGYKGVLCGECQPGYGRDSAGECVRCDQSLVVTRLTIAAVTLFLFGVVSVKLLLEINNVQKTVAFELGQEEKRVREGLNRAASQSGTRGASDASRSETSQGGGEVTLSIRQKSRASTSGEKTGTRSTTEPEGKGRAIGTLQRTEQHVEEPRDVTNDEVSVDAMQAAGILSETYKILFNYVQLNSLAFFLGVDWKSATNGLLSGQVLAGRLFAIGIYPLGCSFADRDNDENIPNSIAVLLLRLAFPWLTLVVYGIAVKAWSLLRKEKDKSKYSIDIVPPLRLVFCVVYFAYFVDINSDLIRLLDCVELLPAPADHPYSEYEVLEAGRVWTQDTSLVCLQGRHLWLIGFAVIGLAASFLFLVSVALILYKGQKQQKLQNPTFRLRYGFLFLKYKTRGLALYWELVINARRMLAAVVTVYVQSRGTTNAEIGLLALIVFIAIILQETVRPFKPQESDNIFPKYIGGVLKRFGSRMLVAKWVTFNRCVTLNGLETASLFMSLSFFLTAVSINGEGEGIVQKYILLSTCFSLNVLFTVFMFYRMWYGLHHYLDISARDKGLKFQGKNDPAEDNNTWLYKKAWTLFFDPQTKTPAVDASTSFQRL